MRGRRTARGHGRGRAAALVIAATLAGCAAGVALPGPAGRVLAAPPDSAAGAPGGLRLRVNRPAGADSLRRFLQLPDPGTFVRGATRIRADALGGGLLLAGTPAPISQHEAPPLSPAQQARWQRALALRGQDRLDAAKQEFQAMLAESPHHPYLLTELARTEVVQQDWAGVERLARTERAAQKDSLLMAPELALACERLGRVRDAAQVATEAWACSRQSEWAGETLLRLAPADPRAIREALQRAAERLPQRGDMAMALARLAWMSGDTRGALQALARADAGRRPSLRPGFAEALIASGGSRDSTGAVDVLLDFAADAQAPEGERMNATRRAWEIAAARGAEADAAPRVSKALKDVAVDLWDPGFLLEVARGLRMGGHTTEARALLGSGARGVDARAATLERALADLRDGPPERALPALHDAAAGSSEAAFRYAEALFFAGQADSAQSWYTRVSEDPSGANAGAALERLYLIEDAQPHDALAMFGRIAYDQWRGDAKRATVLADSLYRTLARGPLWAEAAIQLAALRSDGGDPRGALPPLLAVADSLPADRLAPLARQRAGDLYLDRLKDDRAALHQYEECLARYPRAWNAAEVRRRLELLRRDRRF